MIGSYNWYCYKRSSCGTKSIWPETGHRTVIGMSLDIVLILVINVLDVNTAQDNSDVVIGTDSTTVTMSDQFVNRFLGSNQQLVLLELLKGKWAFKINEHWECPEKFKEFLAFWDILMEKKCRCFKSQCVLVNTVYSVETDNTLTTSLVGAGEKGRRQNISNVTQ